MTSSFDEVSCYIRGLWLKGEGETIVSINPTTGGRIAVSRAASRSQVAAAISAARQAFDAGDWSRLGPAERSALLHRLADLIERDREKISTLAAKEIGTPVSSAALNVDIPVRHFRWFADAALRGPRDGYEEPLPLHHDPVTSSGMLLREPVGVVAAVVAYNVPVFLCAYKLGAALAAGCSVVLLASPKALMLTATVMALVEEAGFPAGAVNLVFGPPSVTDQVVSAPEVDLVTFTGSAAVGSKILRLAAPTLKKVVLELGGKSPNILLPGTDIERAVPASVHRFTVNSGQACGATSRTFVPMDDFDEYIERSGDYIRNMKIGDPLHSDTVLGPLITDEHRRSVEEFIGRAVEAGAEVSVGGGRPADLDDGFFLEPTLVTRISNEAEIAQEELFAPVGVVIPYTDLDEALRMANDAKYALNANVWGPTPAAIDLARRIRSGTVTINGGGGRREDAPWGGPGYSGIGREGGEEGFREFFDVKHVQWPL